MLMFFMVFSFVPLMRFFYFLGELFLLSLFDDTIIPYCYQYVNRFFKSFLENVAQNDVVKTVQIVLSKESDDGETVLCRITENCREKMSLFSYANSGII